VVLFRSQDGLRLGGRLFEAPSSARLPLLCLPGLSRNSRDFLKLGTSFSRHPAEPRRVVALDYRGRGLSDHDPDWRHYTPLVEAQDALAAAAVFGLERTIVVGTSRGGIIAMLLAAMRPGLMAGVVLNDIGAVIEGTGLARIRKTLSARRPPVTLEQAVTATSEAGRAHFPALNADDWRATVEAFHKETPRGLIPDFDANLMKAFGDAANPGRVPVLWPQFEALAKLPVLVIRGEHSDILSARTVAAMAERHPRLEQFTVEGQGHAPLLRDQPTLERLGEFARLVDLGSPG
jgi:pimeloyl-ACP methyl ester carboxylesterase